MAFIIHGKNSAQNEDGVLVRFRDFRSIEYSQGDRTLVIPRDSGELPSGDEINYLYLQLPLSWNLPSGNSPVLAEEVATIQKNIEEALNLLGSKVKFEIRGNATV